LVEIVIGQKRRLMAPLLLLVLGVWTHAAEAPALPALLAAARQTHLAEHPQWLTLLHVRPGIRGRRSLIDEPRFFLSPQGKIDPQAELEATLAGLLTGDPAHAEESAAARFPARAHFLAEQLGFDLATLPVAGSREFAENVGGFAPRKIWLVFPTGYLSSPASMFGHTLLLIQGTNDSPLLSQSLSYAAEIPGQLGGPLQILRGLTGGFRGYFTSLPYHRKVQEYTDLDQRDIWEYQLNLTPEEIVALLRHAWELRGIGSDYWFFDENCSYNLLFLIEAARPGLRLSERAGWWVIPLDTIRWLADAQLILNATYRPSRATSVEAARRSLPAADADLAVAIARGKQPPSAAQSPSRPPADQAHVLDLAGESLHALAGRQQISLADYRQRLHQTLVLRSGLGLQPALPSPPQPSAPDKGHASGRLSIGAGIDAQDEFAALEYRAAQHDLLDLPDGYPAGAALTFGELDLRWYRKEKLVLERLEAVRVLSLSPSEPVFRRLSWTAGGGLKSERMGAAGEEHLQAQVDAEVGFSAQLPYTIGWVLAGADARGFGIAEGYAVGPTLQAGVATGQQLRAMLLARVTPYVLGWEDTAWSVDAGARWTLRKDWAIDVQGSRYHRWEHTANSLSLRFMSYF
jgi:hypothetical protein